MQEICQVKQQHHDEMIEQKEMHDSIVKELEDIIQQKSDDIEALISREMQSAQVID